MKNTTLYILTDWYMKIIKNQYRNYFHLNLNKITYSKWYDIRYEFVLGFRAWYLSFRVSTLKKIYYRSR